MRVKLLLISLASAAAMGLSCSPKSEPTLDDEPIMLLAVDTSGSAVSSHKQYFQRAAEMIQSLPESQDLYLYRFDSVPAETWSEPPPREMDKISLVLNSVLRHRSDHEGTNLARLFELMERRVRAVNVAVQIVVLTDCGIEKMSDADVQTVRELTRAWKDDPRITSLKLIGVRDSFREPLRDMIMMDDQKFFILK